MPEPPGQLTDVHPAARQLGHDPHPLRVGHGRQHGQQPGVVRQRRSLHLGSSSRSLSPVSQNLHVKRRRQVNPAMRWAMMVSHGRADPAPARRDRVEPVRPAHRPHRHPAHRPRRGGRRRAGAGAGPARHRRRVHQPGAAGRAHRASWPAWPGGRWPVKVDPDLWEWDYGGYEGRTTAEIQEERPGWYLWRDGVIPGDAEHPGETVAQVGERADAVLARVRAAAGRRRRGAGRARPLPAHADRPLAGAGRRRRPAVPAGHRHAVSTLGTEHGKPVITAWNVPPPSA